MDPFETDLSPEEKEMAYNLWMALENPHSQAELAAAREAFKNAPEPVRSAVLRAEIKVWRGAVPTHPTEEPLA